MPVIHSGSAVYLRLGQAEAVVGRDGNHRTQEAETGGSGVEFSTGYKLLDVSQKTTELSMCPSKTVLPPTHHTHTH